MDLMAVDVTDLDKSAVRRGHMVTLIGTRLFNIADPYQNHQLGHARGRRWAELQRNVTKKSRQRIAAFLFRRISA